MGDARCAVWVWFNPGTQSWVVTLHGAGLAYFHAKSFEDESSAISKAGEIASALDWKVLTVDDDDVPRWLRPGE